MCEQADNHRHRETQKSAEQDVLGVHQLFVVSQFSKTKHRFCREQVADSLHPSAQDEGNNQDALQIADVGAGKRQAFFVGCVGKSTEKDLDEDRRGS